MKKPLLNIAMVERDTGLSKDVLRVWERRYGFPVPKRNANGERVYTEEQVDRLRTVKRLMDQGHRPGKLLSTAPKDWPRTAASSRPPADDRLEDDLQQLLALLRQHDAPGLATALQQRLARQGLARFVQDTLAGLSSLVGQSWEAGALQVYEEHLFSEVAKRLLRQAIATVPLGERPTVLLTTLPGEQHELGLLMAESALALDGACCVSLGTQLPLLDVVRAASDHRADVVALSFSAAYSARAITAALQQLRTALPARVDLWVGGAGAQRCAAIAGVTLFTDLHGVAQALAGWREGHATA